MNQRFGYLQQHVAPSLTERMARELEAALLGILEAVCGLKIPHRPAPAPGPGGRSTAASACECRLCLD